MDYEEPAPPPSAIPYGSTQKKEEGVAKLIHEVKELKYDNQGRKISGETPGYVARNLNLETMTSLANLEDNDMLANYHMNEVLTILALRAIPKEEGLLGVIETLKGRKLMDMKESMSKKGFGHRQLSTTYSVHERHEEQRIGELKNKSIFDRIRGR